MVRYFYHPESECLWFVKCVDTDIPEYKDYLDPLAEEITKEEYDKILNDRLVIDKYLATRWKERDCDR